MRRAYGGRESIRPPFLAPRPPTAPFARVPDNGRVTSLPPEQPVAPDPGSAGRPRGAFPGSASRRGGAARGGLGLGLILALTLQTAVPPFATDMYTPALTQVTADLSTSASLVGLTMTTFFLGMAAGQLIGGSLSDQFGRRAPLILGGVLCTLGAIGCVLAPSITVLLVARLLQGFGGGVAAVVARSVVVDLAHGELLAQVMSIMMALGGLAPMIAPVIGGAVLTLGGTWRTVFGCLVLFGLVMTVVAAAVVPESLPRDRRRSGGLRSVLRGMGEVLAMPVFLGYALVGALSGFMMFAYIADSSYVLQGMKGVSPMAFALFFGGTALVNVLLALVNSRALNRFEPRTLVRFGLILGGCGVAILALSVPLLGVPLILTCIGFVVLMSGQAFVMGNASALAVGQARHMAGTASAAAGVLQALATSASAPLASAGGSESALPMLAVMVVGILGAVIAFVLVGRAQRRAAGGESPA